MIEIECLVPCISKESINLAKYKNAQTIVYLSDPSVEKQLFNSNISSSASVTSCAVGTPRLVRLADYKPLDSSQVPCRYAPHCKRPNCKFSHAPRDLQECLRGPTCEFRKLGKCAFQHTVA